MNLAIGKQFPNLGLPDHTGKRVRLAELAGGFPLILAFYRGFW